MYEFTEIEVIKASNDFNAGQISVKQFLSTVQTISENCNTILNCLLSWQEEESLTPFERALIKSAKEIKLSAVDVCKNLAYPPKE